MRKRTLKQKQIFQVLQNQALCGQRNRPKKTLCEKVNAHCINEQSRSRLGTSQPRKRACSFFSGLYGEEKTLDTHCGVIVLDQVLQSIRTV